MNRITVAIIFGSEPNIDKNAFEYFILSVNKFQHIYEFCFPDITSFPVNNRGAVDDELVIETVNKFVSQNHIIANHVIAILTNSFNNSFFFNATHTSAVITTDVWDKHFTPPSVFEYLLFAIITCLVYSKQIPPNTNLTSEQRAIDLSSHRDTRGCIADFTRRKCQRRVGIALGYICEEHAEKIGEFYGQAYLSELRTIVDRSWIGDTDKKNSVAYNLKHLFKIDLNRDSGFNKTWWENVRDKFYEIPGTLVLEILKVTAIVILLLLLMSLGLPIEVIQNAT